MFLTVTNTAYSVDLGLGFVTSITFIFLVGVFMSSWLGASVLSLGEWFIKRMPFIRHIYNASKQISAAISPGQLVFPVFRLLGGGVLLDMDSEFCNHYYCRSEHAGFQRSGYNKASTYW